MKRPGYGHETPAVRSASLSGQGRVFGIGLSRTGTTSLTNALCRLGSFEALDAGYPYSKFILTTRDRESWLGSCQAFWRERVDPFLADSANDAAGGDYIRLICMRLYGSVEFEPGLYAEAFDDYHRRVRGHFRDRPQDLLVLDIGAGAGWEPFSRIDQPPDLTRSQTGCATRGRTSRRAPRPVACGGASAPPPSGM